MAAIYGLIVIGCLLGGAIRHGMTMGGLWLDWPLLTVMINGWGMFALANLVIPPFQGRLRGEEWPLFTLGVCSGYGGVGAFSLQFLHMFSRLEWVWAMGNLLLCLLLTCLGLWWRVRRLAIVQYGHDRTFSGHSGQSGS